MASSKQAHEFYSQWFPTVRSFLRLYSGREDLAAHTAVEVFCEYMRSGLPLEMDEMPLVLWECTVGAVECSQPSRPANARPSEFERSLGCLQPEERLAFLLYSVFGLPMTWIALITDWSVQQVDALVGSSSARMRLLLGFPDSTPSSVIEQYATCQRSVQWSSS